MKGDGNEQIRPPPGNLRPESFAHFFCVKMGKSSLIVILELIDRPGHRLFVKPETYALIKRTADLHAVPAVFLFRRSDRPAALHTPGLPDDQPVHGFAACRGRCPAGWLFRRTGRFPATGAQRERQPPFRRSPPRDSIFFSYFTSFQMNGADLRITGIPGSARQGWCCVSDPGCSGSFPEKQPRFLQG